MKFQKHGYIKLADRQIVELYRKEIKARQAGDLTLVRVLRRKREGLMALRGDFVAKVALTRLNNVWQPV